jgi:hypothetical protein
LVNRRGEGWQGSGRGSDSRIAFTPSRFSTYCSKKSSVGKAAGAQPDDILLHEIVHAMRQMRGKSDLAPLGHGFDTEEEFYAILLTNIYASEAGRQQDLRANHHGFDPIDASQDTDAEFLPAADKHDYRYRLVDKMVHQEPKLVAELRAVKDAAFNPIRRYYELQTTKVAMPGR